VERVSTEDGVRRIVHDRAERRHYVGNGSETVTAAPIDVESTSHMRKRAQIQKEAIGIVPRTPGMKLVAKNALKPVAAPVNEAIARAGNRIRPRL